MSLIIKQLSTTDREDAAAFWNQNDQADGDALPGPEAPTLDTNLSLIAIQDGQTIGLTLCHLEINKGQSHQLTIVTTGDDQLLQHLIDKSLAKLTQHGVHKCQVNLLGHDQPDHMWQQTSWHFGDAEGGLPSNDGTDDAVATQSQETADSTKSPESDASNATA